MFLFETDKICYFVYFKWASISSLPLLIFKHQRVARFISLLMFESVQKRKKYVYNYIHFVIGECPRGLYRSLSAHWVRDGLIWHPWAGFLRLWSIAPSTGKLQLNYSEARRSRAPTIQSVWHRLLSTEDRYLVYYCNDFGIMINLICFYSFSY